MECVIANYNEPINWIDTLPTPQVYTKGRVINHPSVIEQLPNVGREGHTFAHYIVTRYDTLPEYVVFLQGNPFDHCPTALEKIKHYSTAPPPHGFAFLAKDIGTLSLNGCKWHPGIPLKQVYKTLFGEPLLTQSFKCGFGAQCIVSRERIRQHPKEFYEKIRDMLAYDNNPIEGFVIERFWGLIFVRDQVLMH